MRPVLLDLLAAYRAGRVDFPLATLPSPSVDWALDCGLAPLLARCCAQDPRAPSSPSWNAILGSDLAARMVAEDQERATVELIEACLPRVGPLTLLKGIWLSHALHPEPHLRPMRDVDVMVEPEAARDVERILIDLGYQPESEEGAFRHHNHLVPYRQPTTGVVIEVHHGLVPIEGPQGSDPFATESVSGHLRPATFCGRPARRLSNELQVAYLAAHWAGSLDVVGGGGGLVIMMDMPALVVDGVDWRTVVDLLSSPAAASATLLILSYLQTRGLLDLEPWVLPAIARRQRAFGRPNLAFLRMLVDRHLVEGRPYGRLLTSHNFDVVWMGLLNPRPAHLNVLSLPWSLLPLRWRRAATPFVRPLARAVGVDLRDFDVSPRGGPATGPEPP